MDKYRDRGEILVPIRAQRIDTDPAGFATLASLHSRLAQITGGVIRIDMSELGWIDAHLASPLLTIIRLAQQKQNTIRIGELNDAVRVILRKNRFLSMKAHDTYQTTIPVREFTTQDGVEFSNYAKSHLSRSEMPRMTRSLRDKFFEGIDELFANCALHSRTKTHVITAGQFFPTGQRLTFSIADGGRGIQGSIKDALNRSMPAPDAISWAMDAHNTTRMGDVPGGLGSQIIREFISKNKGKIVVVSNDGFWSQSGERVYKRQLSAAYPGTAVVLEINTADRHSYDLRAPHPKDIW